MRDERGFVNEAARERFENVVLEIVTDFDPTARRALKNMPGPSVSLVMRQLRERGWKNLGSNGEVELAVEEIGFTVVRVGDRFFVTL